MLDAEYAHPPSAFLAFGFICSGVETYGILQSACHHLYHRDVMMIGTMHLGRDIANMALDLPDALARTSFPAKQTDVTGIGLRIVGANEGE